MDIAHDENALDVLNWYLRRTMELLNEARNDVAVSGPSKPPADVLDQITQARRYFFDAERLAVALMRRDGVAWADIADRLGVTKQAAYARFGKAARVAVR